MTHFKYIILLISSFVFRNKKSKVIYYHDVHSDKEYTNMSTPMDLFKNHINYLKKTYTIVKDITEKEKQIIICFDDGFKGLYENKSYFIQNKIYIKVFLISGFIGRENYLSLEEIKELNQYENFSFGAHTHTHCNLGELEEEKLRFELKECKSILENTLGKTVDSLCFPRGSFSNKVIDFSKEAGYKSLFASIPGDFYSGLKLGYISRNLVQSDDMKTFKLSLSGAQNIFKKRRLKQHFNTEK